MTQQKTLRQPITFRGKTVFSGEETSITIHPADAGFGIVFDVDGCMIPARVDYVADGFIGHTALKREGVYVAMVEHLLAALRGLGIDNARIEVEGSEIPMADGSTQPFIDAIDSVGLETLDAERVEYTLTEPLYWSDGKVSIVALPFSEFKVSYTWYAPQSKAFNTGFCEEVVTPEVFRSKIGAARTFGFEPEVKQAMAIGLIKGAGLDRGVLIRDDQVVNAGGLRFSDELVRHKVLDIIGDLSLIGSPVNMHVIALRSGHAANVRLAHAVFDLLQKEKVNEPALAKTAT